MPILIEATVSRAFHPQVDHVDQTVAADHEEIAPRGRDTADMHRIAVSMTDTISCVFPSISATCPASRSVTADVMFSRSRLFICLVGRSSGLTTTFQLFFISGMPPFRGWRLKQQVAGHQVDIGLVQL